MCVNDVELEILEILRIWGIWGFDWGFGNLSLSCELIDRDIYMLWS